MKRKKCNIAKKLKPKKKLCGGRLSGFGSPLQRLRKLQSYKYSLGTNEVLNPNFDNNTVWVATASAVEISGGSANFNGVIGNLTQTLSGVIQDEDYYVKVKTTGTYAGSGLTVRLGDLTTVIANIDRDGTHDAVVTVNGTGGIRFRVTATDDFVGKIDDVEVRRILS